MVSGTDLSQFSVHLNWDSRTLVGSNRARLVSFSSHKQEFQLLKARFFLFKALFCQKLTAFFFKSERAVLVRKLKVRFLGFQESGDGYCFVRRRGSC